MACSSLALVLACLGLLAVCPVPLAGQVPPSPPGPTAAAEQAVAGQRASSVDAIVAEAQRLLTAGQLEEARARADQAVTHATKAGDVLGLARAERMTAALLQWEGRDQDARPWLERAVEGFRAAGEEREAALALTALAQAMLATGDERTALALAEESAQALGRLGDDRGRAIALLTIARLTTADMPRRTSAVDEALAIAERLDDAGIRGLALKARAAHQFGSGDLAGAQASLEAAVTAFERAGDVASLGGSFLQLGRVLRAHGDPEGALRYYRRAVDATTGTRQTQVLVEAMNAIGVAISALGRRGEAIAAYERGLSIARASGNQRLIDFMLGNLGGALVGAKEYERAVTTLREVLARQPDGYVASIRHAQLAEALGRLGRFDEALGSATEAVRLTRELQLTDALDQRLEVRGWIFDGLGRLDEALLDYREAIDVIERVRARILPADFLKRGYGDRVQVGYARAIDLAARMGRLDEALELSEQARARAFLDLLATRRSARATPASTAAATGDLVLRSDRSAQALPLASMRALAARLDATLLAYWVNDQGTIAWVVRADGSLRGERLPVGRDVLADLVGATTKPLSAAGSRRGATSPEGAAAEQAPAELGAGTALRGLGLLSLTDQDRTAWRRLHDALVEPLRTALPPDGSRLVIVPHGTLFRLSFAALQDSSGRYLLERYDISYAPSAAVLAMTDEAGSRADGPWLLVGNPASMASSAGRPLASLPAAARELSAVRVLAPLGRVITLDGPRATTHELQRTLESQVPSVLHIATHGIVSDDATQPSFLALSRDSQGEGDGRLTEDQVYGLDLSADLVVLSACRTGAGPVTGDGVVGLTRAFFAAGAASIVASFWNVADEPTSLLMQRFYRGYATTGQKSRSLREAQLGLLADLRAGRAVVKAGARRATLPEHPLLWAGFFLSGDR